MKDILFIFIGGGVGSVLRYLTSLGWKFWQSGHGVACSFPWPTLIVNVVGCFLIGLFYKYSGQWGWSDDTRLLMTTGLCGGFTTFSTFGYEGLAMLRGAMYGQFALYFGLSLLLGLLAIAIPTICK